MIRLFRPLNWQAKDLLPKTQLLIRVELRHLLPTIERPLPVCSRPSGPNGGRAADAAVQIFG